MFLAQMIYGDEHITFVAKHIYPLLNLTELSDVEGGNYGEAMPLKSKTDNCNCLAVWQEKTIYSKHVIY